MNTIRANPYVGPRSFELNETLYGRSRELRMLSAQLISERVVLLHSPSGAGKTSLIQAGLVPLLREEKFHILPVARVNLEPNADVIQTPGFNRYIYSVIAALEEGLPLEQRRPLAALAGLTLDSYLTERPRPADAPRSELLLFDQFEEILTIAPTDREGKQAFFTQLGAALRNSTRWALFAMREDYLGSIAPYVRPLPNRFEATFRLDLLGVDAALQAIQSPARGAGVDFIDDAAHKLVDDLRRVQVQQPDGTVEAVLGEHIEPVQLQVVCFRLWQSLDEGDSCIDLNDLAAVGDVDQSLADYYALSISGTAAQLGLNERALREWFETKLITKEGIRGQVLMGVEASDGLDNRAVRLLENAHIIRAEKRAGATWFELSHDRLIQPVKKNNAQWFGQNLSLFQRQAVLWNQQGRSEGLLLRGKEFQQAEKEAKALQLTGNESAFLEACYRLRENEQRERRRNTMMTILAIGATIAMIVAGIFYFRAQVSATEAKTSAEQAAQLADENAKVAATAQAAEAEAKTAEQQAVDAQALTEKTLKETEIELRKARNQQLSAQAEILKTEKPFLAMLLALEAIRMNQDAGEPISDSAYQSLRNTLAQSYGIPLPGNTDTILTMAFSQDTHWFATGGKDRLVRIWDLQADNFQNKPAFSLDGHGSDIIFLAFGNNGRLASGDSDGIIHIWDVSSTSSNPSSLAFSSGQGNIQNMTLSPNGRWLVLDHGENKIIVWDLKQPDPETNKLELSTGALVPSKKGLVFSPDGKWLIAACGTNILAWRVDLDQPLQQNLAMPRLVGPDGVDRSTAQEFSDVSFSADNKWMISGGYVWELASMPSGAPMIGSWGGNELQLTRNLSEKMYITQDYRIIGSVSESHLYRISPNSEWSAWTSQEISKYIESYYYSSYYSDANYKYLPLQVNGPSGQFELSGHTGPVSDLVFSPDNHWLISLGGQLNGTEGDGSLRFWDLTSPNPSQNVIVYPTGSRTPIMAASADFHWLAVTSDENVVRLLDIRSMNILVEPFKFNDSVSLVTSPNSRWLLSELSTVFETGTPFETRHAYSYDISGKNSFLLPQSELKIGKHKPLSKFSPGSSWLYLYESGSNKVIHNVLTGNSARLFGPTWDWFFTATDKWMVDITTARSSNSNMLAFSLYNLDSRTPQDENILAEPLLKDIFLYRSNWYPNAIRDYGKYDQPYSYYTTDNTYPDQGILFDSQDNWLAISRGADTFIADLRATDKIASRSFVTKDFSTHAISADGKTLSIVDLATGKAGLVKLDQVDFDAKKAHPVLFQDILLDNEAPVFAAFSPDARWVSISTCVYAERDIPDGTTILRDPAVSICKQAEPANVYLWDISQPDPAASMIQVSGAGSFKISFSSDSRWLAAFESSGKTILFDLLQPNPASVELTSWPAGKFSPDSRWLLTLSGYDQATAYDLSSTGLNPIPLNSPGYQVLSLKFSPDGTWLAGGTTDGKVLLWNMLTLDTDTIPYILRGGNKAYEDLFFTNDGRWLFAGGAYANYVGWRMETQELINLACVNAARNLTRAEWAQYGFTEDYRATCLQWPVELEPIATSMP